MAASTPFLLARNQGFTAPYVFPLVVIKSCLIYWPICNTSIGAAVIILDHIIGKIGLVWFPFHEPRVILWPDQIPVVWIKYVNGSERTLGSISIVIISDFIIDLIHMIALP